jgi:hypothetical protein
VRSWVCALLAASGCSFGVSALEFSVPVDAGEADAPGAADGGGVADGRVPDGRTNPDAPGDCAWGFAPTGFDPCALPASNGTANEGVDAIYDTDTGVTTFGDGTSVMPISALLPQSGATAVRVLVFDRFTIDAPIRVRGSHPLLIVGLDTIEIGGPAGVIDLSAVVSADGRSTPGAGGADSVACGDGGAGGGGGGTQGESSGAGGGGGGGFGDAGGQGGGAENGVQGGAPGKENGGGTLAPLRGGCSGGSGGQAHGQTAGAGGAPGGAVHVAARNAIVLTPGARIQASGAGGVAGTSRSGGGGGGSGGGIFLESFLITFVAQTEPFSIALCANGGSGGEGGGGPSGLTSSPGSSGTCNGLQPAVTPNRSGGGDGGNGGAVVAPAGGSGASGGQVGGGGGGGGVGRIRLRSIEGPVNLTGITLSPLPVTE